MPSVTLTDRALIRVSGPEAEHFLQNIVTADVSDLPAGAAKPCALLTPQGKILFDYLISRDGADAFMLDVRRDVAEDFMRRLTLYKLRAKAQISMQDEEVVTVDWETDSVSEDSGSGAGRLRDLRFAGQAVWRRASGTPGTDPRAAWDRLRIDYGVAESGSDYQLSDAFPHDVLLDQNDGVGFRKGCYVGQEVVSRMQHRGTARRRILIATADVALPAPGTEVTANGRSIGSLGTVDGRRGLAMVRIDRVKDAMDAGVPVLAGDATLELTIPPDARFSFSTATDAGDA